MGGFWGDGDGPKDIAPIAAAGGAGLGFFWGAGWGGGGSFSNRCAGAVGFGRSAGMSRRRLSALKSLTWRRKSPGVSMWEVAKKMSFLKASDSS